MLLESQTKKSTTEHDSIFSKVLKCKTVYSNSESISVVGATKAFCRGGVRDAGKKREREGALKRRASEYHVYFGLREYLGVYFI